MSVNLPPSNPTRSAYADPARSSSRRGSPWARLAVVAAVLAASGGARAWQERRVERALEQGKSSPFPMADLPMTIGPWEGKASTMDPRIVRSSGSTDLVTRRYVDRRTGVGLDVVVLYGPTSDMFIHTPELCYPAAGYEPLPDLFERAIPLEGNPSATVPFRSLAFTKGEGGLSDSQEVYYSLRYDGRWTTRTATPRASKRSPGMVKVQVSRRISPRERRDVDNPTEPFLAALVGQIEARMAGSTSTASR